MKTQYHFKKIKKKTCYQIKTKLAQNFATFQSNTSISSDNTKPTCASDINDNKPLNLN